MSDRTVSHVMFLANINIDGRMGNNIEAARDGIDLQWHEATGGVLVRQGGKEHYVSPQSIMSVTFLPDEQGQSDAPSDAPSDASNDVDTSDAIATPHPADADSSLAESVLKEFSAEAEATPQPKPKSKRELVLKTK